MIDIHTICNVYLTRERLRKGHRQSPSFVLSLFPGSPVSVITPPPYAAMGQRHQAFVIARIRPHGSSEAKYRCISAHHHQWCYGRLPLHAAHRMLGLVRHPDHAQIIRYEVEAVHDKYGRHEQTPPIPDVPCPFITMLMSQAFAVDLEDREKPYASLVHVEEAGMGCFDGGA
jgi:hypothetical protein